MSSSQRLTTAQQLVKYRLIQLPGPMLVGVRQRRADRSPPHAQVLQFPFARRQASTDFSQRLRSTQLAKQHRHELIPTAETTRLPLGFMLLNQSFKL